MTSTDAGAGSTLPDPRVAENLDDLMSVLHKTWIQAGKVSHRRLHSQVEALRKKRVENYPGAAPDPVSKNTVYNLLNMKIRKQPSLDLVIDVLTVMRMRPEYIDWWRTAWTTVFSARAPAPVVNVNGELPAEPQDFVGRRREVELITSMASAAGVNEVVVVALVGMPGVGKTWLAVRVAHQLVSRGWFGDVQLHVDLGGFDPEERPPAEPDLILQGLLRKLGVRGRLPTSRAEKIAAYRKLMQDRRGLVLLDNAVTGEQVRDLLPDVPSTLVIVTSRHHLTGLPDNVRQVEVNVFDEADALDLLTAVAGLEPRGDERDTLRQLARQCGYLPQALAPIASHIRDHDDWTLVDHLHALQDLVLEGDMGAALTLSYRGLPAEQQRMLRLLAASPCRDATSSAGAALIDTDAGTADTHMRHLTRAHLLRQRTPGRYELHDLVRAHARRKGATDEPASKRAAALSRLTTHYLQTASVAVDLLDPLERFRRPNIPAPTHRLTTLDNMDEARDWLDTERANLLDVAVHSDYPDSALFSRILHPYLLAGGYYVEAKALHNHAVLVGQKNGDRPSEVAARESLGIIDQRTGRYDEAIGHLQWARAIFYEWGDFAAQARAMGNLAIVYARMGRYDEAIDHLERAQLLFSQVEDLVGQARAMGNIAIIHARTGQYQEAIHLHQKALALWRDLEDQRNHAATLNNLGAIYARIGRCREAADHHRAALALSREHGIRDGEARALTNLGVVDEQTGHPGRAVDRHRQAQELFHELRDPEGEAWALTNLGTAHTKLRHYVKAVECLKRAREMFRELGDPAGHAAVLNRLGEASNGTEPTRVIELHTEAHRYASEIGDRYEQARAHASLGEIYHSLGTWRRAHWHWRQANDLYIQLDVPEGVRVQNRLNEIDNEGTP